MTFWESIHFGNHQIGNLLPFDHGPDTLFVVQIKMINKGYRSPGHIQRIERKNSLRLLRADQRHAGMIFACKVHTGKGFRVPFPIAEHLPVGIGPIAVVDRNAFQALLAVGIQFPDKGPAFLIRQFSAVKALLNFRQLLLLDCFHPLYSFLPLHVRLDFIH